MFDHLLVIVTLGGLLGVAALMFAENIFPPIPSELIMPLAGFLAARGQMSLPGAIVAGAAGALTGALVWYGVGRWVGEARLTRWAARWGRWLTLSPADVGRAASLFRRYGPAAVFFGRLIPGVRTYISVPAGVSRMAAPAFLLWTALGSTLWTALLAYAGYRLEQHYTRVADWLDPATQAVLGGCVLAYLYRVATFRPDAAR